MRGRRWVAVLAVVLFALAMVRELSTLVLADQRLPQWDMAKYGVSGLRIAAALSAFDLPDLARAIHDLSVWPPFFPGLLAALFLIVGQDFQIAALLVVALFGSLLLATFAAAQSFGRSGGMAAGLLATAIVGASPFLHTLSSLVMLEIPGLFLSALALFCYRQALASDGRWSWRATWVVSCALFFCKYNYGILWLAPLLAHETWRRCGSWANLRVLAESCVLRLWQSRWGRFTVGVVVLLLTLRASGQDLEIFGRSIRLASVGNAFQVLFMLLLIRLAWYGWRYGRLFLAQVAAVDRRLRGAVMWLFLPLAAWMALPPHLKDFVGFVENRHSGVALLSFENLVFYPRAFIDLYAVTPDLGRIVLLAGAFQLLRLWRRPDQRIVACATVFAFAALLLHPYKQDRFAVVAFWWLALCAALLFEDLLATLALPRTFRAWLALGLGCVALAWVGARGVDESLWRTWTDQRTVPAGERALLTWLQDRQDQQKLVVLGTWNLFSPWLLEWHGRLGSSHWPVNVRDLTKSQDPARLKAAINAAVLASGELRIVRLDRREQFPQPEFAAETAWLLSVRVFLGERCNLLESAELEGSAYRVELFSCSSPR